jgi:hypothetical protein
MDKIIGTNPGIHKQQFKYVSKDEAEEYMVAMMRHVGYSEESIADMMARRIK